MIEIVMSKNRLPIRLTDERWSHITEEHTELAGMKLEVLETISEPTRILAGRFGELLAVREVSPEKHLVVVYRELQSDGFIITAFMTSKTRSLERRLKLWPS